MTKRKRLNVSDLYKSLGSWNNLYGRVIALNTLVFSSGQLHYSFKRSLAWKRESFEFYDCDGCFYTAIDANATLFLERKYGDSKATFTTYEYALFVEGGEIFGLLLLIALYKLNTSSHLTIAALMYTFCPLVHFTRSKTFARASLFLSGASIRMIRVPTMMHCMESLPQHLRVYGLSIMFCTGVISNLWLVMFVRLVSHSLFWTHAMIAVAFLITCSVHIWFAPPSIMNTLYKAEAVVLNEQLSKWVPNDELVNIDDLIDNVLYRGPVFSSQMNSFSQIVAMGPFLRKFLICAALLPLDTIIQSMSDSYRSRRLNIGAYEGDFVLNVAYFIGIVVTVYLNIKYGRRFPLGIGLAFSVISLMIMTSVTLESYNACWRVSTPHGWRAILANLAYVCAIICSVIIKVTIRLVLFENVPTSVRSLVPVAFFYAAVMILVTNSLVALTKRAPS
uniref:MFS transporter n=1 Tax=Haemonchus contortus TaxID=6289 RepID=A0A7I5EDB3_HAECO